MNAVIFVLAGIVALGILVTIHEMGHFLMARWMGVRVEAFSIGWGPVLVRFPWLGTEFRLSLIPMGGYCKLKGDEDLQRALEKGGREWEAEEGSFFHVAPWRRLLIALAGPLFNFASAFLLLSLLGATGYQSRDLPSRIVVESEGPASPAAQAGLRTGDLILAIDDRPLYTFEDLQRVVRSSGGRSMRLLVEREGERISLAVQPTWDEELGRYRIGVSPYYVPVLAAVEPLSPADRAGLRPGDRIVQFEGRRVDSWNVILRELESRRTEYHLVIQRDNLELERKLRIEVDRQGALVLGWRLELPLLSRPPLGFPDFVVFGWERSMGVLASTVEALAGLLRGKNLDRAIAGPIRTSYTLGQAAALSFAEEGLTGVAMVVQLLSFISLVLFIMNLLPIPALDGGLIMISLVETLRGKQFRPRTFLNFQRIGTVFLVLVLAMAVLTDLFFLTGL